MVRTEEEVMGSIPLSSDFFTPCLEDFSHTDDIKVYAAEIERQSTCLPA
jgi:hypothetical protein